MESKEVIILKEENPNPDCHLPEVKEKHGGKCSDEQVIKCHGKAFLEELRRKEAE